MPFPFGKSHKSPADIVKNLKESMAVLEKQDISDKKVEKVTFTFTFYGPVLEDCLRVQIFPSIFVNPQQQYLLFYFWRIMIIAFVAAFLDITWKMYCC